MASAGYTLQQQKGSVETRIKLLINSDLKEICKAYNYQVSGTKAVLQKRCIEILSDIVNRGDDNAFKDLNYRVAHHGRSPPQPNGTSVAASSNYTTPNGYHNNSNNQMAPGRPPAAHNRYPTGGRYFRSSPFYEVQETIMGYTELHEMPQNRHTVRQDLRLTADQVARLKSDPSFRIMLYCGLSSGMNQWTTVDVAFPNQLEVKINDDDVRANFKGLKNKPGSTKPADITDKVRKNAGYPNRLAITYALTTKRYAFVIHLVKYINADVLTERIQKGQHGGGIISKQKVLQEMQKANADDDIVATSVTMTLKDPISALRIETPVRSTVCSHNQCFEAKWFLQLQDQAPQWSCPVCSKSVSYESLCVDKYFEEILQKTPSSIESIHVEPNGEWQMIKEEEDPKPQGHSSRNNRAAYDDDFDDDLIEIVEDQPVPKPAIGGAAIQYSTPSLLSPATNSTFPLNTPPLSSRGNSVAPSMSSVAQSNKRPASSVIDLTLSDNEEEEQMPRSGKRQQTGSQSTPPDRSVTAGAAVAAASTAHNTTSGVVVLQVGQDRLSTLASAAAQHTTRPSPPPKVSPTHPGSGGRPRIIIRPPRPPSNRSL
ncbi:hypothetical protein DOTSEDRAFT_45227 [Dothistroma septosporum NZE10]|uniref:Uncharacterized protein n=1 Tax=Dothistroma septosporum (strain NZE10 / CBS 128990) TaxID=675120 RepID=M2YMT3_DOTSN|nr:hypothetical protein DOTSEDRAFT_45227 [Dothistroma septosporum NZE10]